MTQGAEEGSRERQPCRKRDHRPPGGVSSPFISAARSPCSPWRCPLRPLTTLAAGDVRGRGVAAGTGRVRQWPLRWPPWPCWPPELPERQPRSAPVGHPPWTAPGGVRPAPEPPMSAVSADVAAPPGRHESGKGNRPSRPQVDHHECQAPTACRKEHPTGQFLRHRGRRAPGGRVVNDHPRVQRWETLSWKRRPVDAAKSRSVTFFDPQQH